MVITKRGGHFCLVHLQNTVRATGAIKQGEWIASLLPSPSEEIILLARMIAMWPQRLKRRYASTHLVNAMFDDRWVLNQVQELRLRGIVISGRLTKYGASLL